MDEWPSYAKDGVLCYRPQNLLYETKNTLLTSELGYLIGGEAGNDWIFDFCDYDSRPNSLGSSCL